MAGKLIFITGATGFIGAHVVRVALEAGHSVRLSIRKPEQEAKIKSRYPSGSPIETVLVTDFASPASFKSALEGVDYVFHLASPLPGSGPDLNKDYVEPAVGATLGVLNAALDAPSVKKVVVTSSAVALLPPDSLTPAAVAADSHPKGNTGEVVPVDPKADYGDGFLGAAQKYCHSKIVAHQATRDFLAEKKPHYDLLTLHPVYVLGDSLTQETASGIEGVNAMFYSSLGMQNPILGTSWVHVRDVADAHIKAIDTDSPTGTEFVLQADYFRWNDAVEYIKKNYPQLECKIDPNFGGHWDADTTAAREILGMKFRGYQQQIKDLLDQQLALQAKA